MTEAVRKEPGLSGFALIMSARHDPAARILNVDLVAVLIAFLLPWSTTGVVIAVALWIIALVPTLQMGAFLRSLKRPVCILPIAMFALALVGTLWSEAPWGERLYGVGPTVKLLVLPLLLYHFERSPRGSWVFVAFLASCALLMVSSWIVAFVPDLSLKSHLSRGPYEPASGIIVKNYIDQGQEFVLCALALAYPALTFRRTNKIWPALLLAAIAAGFVANMMFVVVSRTALATMPILLGLFALLYLQCRTVIAALCTAVLLAAVVWNVSPALRATASKFVSDYQHTRVQNNVSGLGSRLEYWQKSLDFFVEAPLIGHGTGSTRGLFEQAAIGERGAQAEVVANPHNQTLNVAVQWGVVGVIVLYAMWLTHLSFFRGEGWETWVGLLVVAQNIVTSLFNSHLFDFVEGWIYVLGVGVAGGMSVGARQLPSGAPPAPRLSCWQAVIRQASAARETISAMPRSSKILGGFAIPAVLLCGSLLAVNYFRVPTVDTPMAREARSIMADLQKYHAARGAYPILDSPLAELKEVLAKDGYLGSASGDLSGTDNAAWYASVNGKSYGLLFHPSGSRCLVEVGRSYIGWGERPPPCPF
jgi:O-antigen ligase